MHAFGKLARMFRPMKMSNGATRLIFILGSQRSGTNALRRSLSLDPYVMGFNESKTSELYEEWKLRPEPVIRRRLSSLPGTVLLKPIQSVLDRDVADFLADFVHYRLDVVWIYRDPVNVYASYANRWPTRADHRRFVVDWNRINASAIRAAQENPRITVVRYEDLVADRRVFSQLGRRLGVRGEYLFSADSNAGYRTLPEETRDDIVTSTEGVLTQLDGQRSVRPQLTV